MGRREMRVGCGEERGEGGLCGLCGLCGLWGRER